MKFTNSSLVNYTKISPNKNTNRTHAIDTITIHCVEGQCSVETLGNEFSKTTKKASSNYGIGYDGKIGMYVEEKDRSWCSSSSSNDNRAITIEVASEKNEPYSVNKEAYNSLIKLLVDICKRNNIKELKWKADKNLIGQVDKQNMTVHRWFANKTCPGTYLYTNMGKIASDVNQRLGSNSVAKPTNTFKSYLVKVTAEALNIRKGPSVTYGITGCIRDKGSYTIIDESNGWGKLKSGKGWINLKYTKKV